MLVLKMMSGEDLSDSNLSKTFTMICCDNVFFKRVDGVPIATVYNKERYPTNWVLHGNAYVMQNGKTISWFAFNEQEDDCDPRD